MTEITTNGLAIWLSLIATTATPAKDTALSDAFHVRGRLANCRVRFVKDKVGRVAFLGGSITHMANGWRSMVCASLAKRFGQTKFDFIDAGIPSTDTAFGPFRLQRDVFARGRVDLLFVEFAVNDSTNGRSASESVRGMEGVIRQARRTNPAIDIVMLHFVDPTKMTQIRQGKTPTEIASHERVAEHYCVSSIDLAAEVTRRVGAGEFTWKQFGGIHPAPFGHKVCAGCIDRLFDAAWSEPLTANAQIRPHRTPDMPIDPRNYGHGRLIDPKQAQIVRGFKLASKWTVKRGHTRPGFRDVPMLVATEPGATLKLPFSGTAVGLVITAGYDAGMVEFAVDGGPFTQVDQYTQWSHHLHIPWALMLNADLKPGKHTLMLRTSEQKNPKSEGHAARIVNFLVNQVN